jgi:release factor glutamine methyltransferase
VTGPAVEQKNPVRAVLEDAVTALTRAGIPTARLDAEWLLADLVGVDRFQLYLADRQVEADILASYRARIARRARQEPLQHILGWEDFRGLRISVSPAALVPRMETEGLVEWALEILPAAGAVSDVGTGSGCIAAALAAARPDLRIIAIDRSLPALAVAAANLRALGLTRRVALVAGDLFGPLRASASRLDLVVANLPYLPSPLMPRLPSEVRDWDPAEALDGGPDGMAVIRRVIADASTYLRPGGWLLTEIGEEQARPLADFMAAHGYEDIRCRRDLRGVDRYLGGRARRTTQRAWASQSPESAARNARSATAGSAPATLRGSASARKGNPPPKHSQSGAGAWRTIHDSSGGSARATALGRGSPGIRGPGVRGRPTAPRRRRPRDEGGQSPPPRDL